jgi:hypothetical protein
MSEKRKALLFCTLDIFFPSFLFIIVLIFLILIGDFEYFFNFAGPDWLATFLVLSVIAFLTANLMASRVPLIAKIKATIYIAGKPYEIVDYGNNIFSISEKGGAGIGAFIVSFFINLVTSPFLIVYWIILVIVIFAKPYFATNYNRQIEEATHKAKTIGFSYLLSVIFALPSFLVCYVGRSQALRLLDEMSITCVKFEVEQAFGEREYYDIEILFGNISSDVKQIHYSISLHYGEQKLASDRYISVDHFGNAPSNGISIFDPNEEYVASWSIWVDMREDYFISWMNVDKSAIMIEITFGTCYFAQGTLYGDNFGDAIAKPVNNIL